MGQESDCRCVDTGAADMTNVQNNNMIKEGIFNRIKEDICNINKEIDKIEKITDVWHLKFYFSRLQEGFDILLTNRDLEIQYLKDRIAELETQEIKDIINAEKVNIRLIYDKSSNWVTASSDSKKRGSIFDERGQKWFIPQLNENSYIKIKFTGKNLDDPEHHDRNKPICVTGISESSGIIGNTLFGKGEFKDIKNNFILNKAALSLLLISPKVWFYALRGTENIELIESSDDIVATLEAV